MRDCLRGHDPADAGVFGIQCVPQRGDSKNGRGDWRENFSAGKGKRSCKLTKKTLHCEEPLKNTGNSHYHHLIFLEKPEKKRNCVFIFSLREQLEPSGK